MFGGMVGAVVGIGALRRWRMTTCTLIRPVGLHGTGLGMRGIRWSSLILIAGWALLWLGNLVSGRTIRTCSGSCRETPTSP